MKLRLLVAAALVSIPHASIPSAHADFREQIRSCMARILKKVMVEPFVADYSGQTLELRFLHPEKAGQTDMTLELGDALGRGFAGTAYSLKGFTGGPKLALPAPEELIAKLSHRMKYEKVPKAKPSKDKSLVSEARAFKTLYSQMDKVWADPEMAQLAEFYNPGSLPISRILADLDTDAGVILIKQKLKGLSMADIVAKYGDDISKLPAEMRESLAATFKLGQIVHRNVHVPASGGRPALMYSPDMKPENFMWISDALGMQRFGLKRPGFVFVEFTHYPSEKWVYDQTTLTYEEYEKIFESYLRFNKK